MQTYYTILGVHEQALPEEIKRAYRRLARKYHPDVAGGCVAGGSGSSSFREVREAYETLSDEGRRRTYDARLEASRRVEEPIASHEAWFADEVGIDFPSLAEAIERIRRAFVDPEEPPRSLRAEILVSAREASEGVDVPLDVPVRGTCEECGGRGETWAEPCAICGGTGEARHRHRVRVSLPAGVADGTRFRFSVGQSSRFCTRVEVRVAVQPARAQESGFGIQDPDRRF